MNEVTVPAKGGLVSTGRDMINKVRKHAGVIFSGIALAVCFIFSSPANAGDTKALDVPQNQVATYSDYELCLKAAETFEVAAPEVVQVEAEVVNAQDGLVWDILEVVDQFNKWLGGTCYAEEVVLPASPISVTDYAAAAFTVFGNTIGAVFPYVLALCGVYLAMRIIKMLSAGRTGS